MVLKPYCAPETYYSADSRSPVSCVDPELVGEPAFVSGFLDNSDTIPGATLPCWAKTWALNMKALIYSVCLMTPPLGIYSFG